MSIYFMSNIRYGKIIGWLALGLWIVVLITVLFFVSPEEVVEKIGVRNGYILAFFVSLFGGFSAGGSVSFITLLITLVTGGMHPIYLGLTAGVSLALGDSIMFFLGSKGRALIKGKWDQKIEKFTNILLKRDWLVKMIPVIAYLYIGLTPLPNDILILFLAAIEYPPRKMYPIIILGDLTFALFITLLAAQGIAIFV
jgi:hypothetical protein